MHYCISVTSYGEPPFVRPDDVKRKRHEKGANELRMMLHCSFENKTELGRRLGLLLLLLPAAGCRLPRRLLLLLPPDPLPLPLLLAAFRVPRIQTITGVPNKETQPKRNRFQFYNLFEIGRKS